MSGQGSETWTFLKGDRIITQAAEMWVLGHTANSSMNIIGYNFFS
jgi:hypothetical protein